MHAMLCRAVLITALLVPAAAQALTVKNVPGPAGTEVWLSEEHTVPMIAVNISLPAGSAYDPAAKPGLASFTASLLDEGAGDLESQAFQQAIEAKAIRLGFSANRDYLVVSLSTLTEHADEAFRLLALALQRPRFDAEPIERMRAQIIASLKQDDEEPINVASKAWSNAYFGTHPYAHDEAGTPESIAAITEADIKAFAASHLVRTGAKIAAAGDITEAQLKRYLDQALGPLSSKAVSPIPRAAPSTPSTKVLPINVPQPAAIFGLPGPMRADPDFIPTYVANYIMGGGGFSSRLMDEVRDKRGLTYGISTAQQDLRAGAIILGSVQSEKSKISLALDVTRAEMAKFAKDGVTAKELQDAKTYLTGSFPLSFDSNVKIANQLNAYQRAGLDSSYVVRRNAMIEAVTVGQVNAMAKKYYDPAKLVVVIAGTPTPASPPVASETNRQGPAVP